MGRGHGSDDGGVPLQARACRHAGQSDSARGLRRADRLGGESFSFSLSLIKKIEIRILTKFTWQIVTAVF